VPGQKLVSRRSLPRATTRGGNDGLKNLKQQSTMNITPRTAITLTFIAFGAMVGSQVGAIPVLKAQSGTDALVFGFLASLGTVATILAMSLGGKVNKRFDHRSVLLFIMPLTFVALVYSLTVHSVLAFALSFLLLSLCTGTMDLFMNAEASVVEHDSAKPIFSSFHGAVLYAIGLFGLIGGFISVKFGPLWAALPTVPFVVAAIFAVNQAIPHRAKKSEDERQAAAPLPRKILVLLGIVLGLDVAAELTCVQWAGQLLNDLQPQLAAYSGLGVAFYGLCNGSMRMVGDRLRARFDDLHLVAASLAIGILGFLVLATGPGFAISVAAFAVVGLGLGLIFPCLFSVAAHLAPEARASALGLASFVSGPPRIILPFVLGYLAQSYGLSMIYVAAAIGIFFALGFTFWAAREIAKNHGAQVSPRPSPSHQ
jgi:predicted MFS family arabinose efflux permease